MCSAYICWSWCQATSTDWEHQCVCVCVWERQTDKTLQNTQKIFVKHLSVQTHHYHPVCLTSCITSTTYHHSTVYSWSNTGRKTTNGAVHLKSFITYLHNPIGEKGEIPFSTPQHTNTEILHMYTQTQSAYECHSSSRQGRVKQISQSVLSYLL